MSTWFKSLLYYIAGLLILSGAVTGEVWMHSSIYIPEIPKDVVITQIGQDQQSWQEAPGVLPSRIKISGNANESLLLAASNGLHLSFKGSGSLTFERFEQRVSDRDLRGGSRSILSMDTGTVEIDSRLLADGSQMLLELPVGSVLLERALGSITLEYDLYRRVYRFALHCAEGSLHLTDLSGERYRIETNQVITGAGSSLKPSLEISELNERMSERLAAFILRCRDEFSDIESDSEAWLGQMNLISTIQIIEDADAFDAKENSEEKQPYIIEFSPRPRLFIPRYGVVRALHEYEEKLQ
jgi:hypothetical protein